MLTLISSIFTMALCTPNSCCCRVTADSVLGPTKKMVVQNISTTSYAIANSVIGSREDDSTTFQGKQLQNFGCHSGFLFFKHMRRRRWREQYAQRKQVEEGFGFVKRATKATALATTTASPADIERVRLSSLDTPASPAPAVEVQEQVDTSVMKELVFAGKDHLVRVVAFLQRPDVEERLHHGLLLSTEQVWYQ